jgi:hypothetical protein
VKSTEKLPIGIERWLSKILARSSVGQLPYGSGKNRSAVFNVVMHDFRYFIRTIRQLVTLSFKCVSRAQVLTCNYLLLNSTVEQLLQKSGQFFMTESYPPSSYHGHIVPFPAKLHA